MHFPKKPRGMRGGGQIDHLPAAVLGLEVARLQVHATKPLKPRVHLKTSQPQLKLTSLLSAVE